MNRVEFPRLRFFTGMFADAAMERDYREATRRQSQRLAAFIALATALIWLVSISHELQIIDAFPGAVYIIGARVFFATCGVLAAGFWLAQPADSSGRADSAVLAAWMALYLVEIFAVSFTYLGLEQTQQGLVDRFLATSFWITLTLGLVGIVNFGFPRHALLFGLTCVIWYAVLLLGFRPADPRPYLIGGSSMLITVVILFLSVGLLGRAGRRSHYLKRVLEQARQKAEDVNGVLALLLTSTGHDTRQPLFALDANAASLRVALQRQDLRLATELADRQRELTRTVSHILSSVLELSRAERNLPGWEIREAVAVQSLMDAVAAQVADLVDADAIELRVRPSGFHVLTNPAMAERILLNLLVNAVRHSGASRILLAARRREGRICIQVLDNGCGLAEQALDLTSADYFATRLASAQSGSGYGLDLVFRMTQLIDADLRVRSRPGSGVAAALCLPQNKSE